MKTIKPSHQLLVSHHITRYLKPSLFSVNAMTGEVFLMENTFFPSQKDEESDRALSVNWMEILGENIEEQIFELTKNRGHVYHKNGKGVLVYFNVGQILDNLTPLKDYGYDAKIVFSPTHTIPSHASVINIPLPSHAIENLRRFNTSMIMSVLTTFPATPKAI